MAYFSLSIYSISINRRNKPEEHEFLDCFDEGKSLMDMIDNLFKGWHKGRHISEKRPVDSEPNRVSRIRQEADGSFIHFRMDPCLSGIIESGAFGTEESIINHKTGDERYRKLKDDAAMVPFYFCFYIPRHSKRGYLVLERIGNNGIYTMLRNFLTKEVGNMLTGGYVLKIEPFIVKSVLNRNIDLMLNLSKVFLRGVKGSVFHAGIPLEGIAGSGSVEPEIVLSVKPQGQERVRNLILSLLNRNDKGRLVVDNVECRDVAFQVKIGGQLKKVSVCNLGSLGTSIDISDTVKRGPDGYPVFKSIEKEAHSLISFIDEASES